MGNWWSYYYHSPQLITYTFHKFMPKSAAAATFTFTNPSQAGSSSVLGVLGHIPQAWSDFSFKVWLPKLWSRSGEEGPAKHNVTGALLPTNAHELNSSFELVLSRIKQLLLRMEESVVENKRHIDGHAYIWAPQEVVSHSVSTWFKCSTLCHQRNLHCPLQLNPNTMFSKFTQKQTHEDYIK